MNLKPSNLGVSLSISEVMRAQGTLSLTDEEKEPCFEEGWKAMLGSTGEVKATADAARTDVTREKYIFISTLLVT